MKIASELFKSKYIFSFGLISARLLSFFSFNKSTNDVPLDALKGLSDNGFFVIENFLSKSDCEKLINIFDESESKATVVGSDRRIFGIENLSYDHKLIFSDSKVLFDIGEAHLNKKQILTTTLAAKLYPSNGADGSGGGWHRDSMLPQFKAICYLTDVELENGPFEYIPESHKLFNKIKYELRSKIRKVANNPRYSEQQIEEYCKLFKTGKHTFCAKRGTVILCNTSGLHRGSPMDKGLRYAVTNYYKSLSLISKSKSSSVYTLINKEDKK